MKKIVPLLMLFFLMALNTNAQYTTCATAYSLTIPSSPYSQTVTTTNNQIWYKVQLDQGDYEIKLTNANHTTKVLSADIYDGSCGALTFLKTDSLFYAVVDSAFTISIHSPTTTVYYLKLTANTSVLNNTLSFVLDPECNIIIYGDWGICPGESAQLLPHIVVSQPPYTFSWSPAGGNVQNPVVTPSVTTVYTLNFTGSGGCNLTRTVTVSLLPPSICPSCNYVKNPSFESVLEIPASPLNSFTYTPNWDQIFGQNGIVGFNTQFLSFMSVPVNSYDHNRPAASGNGYIGLSMINGNFGHAYAMSKLKCPLFPGQSYEVSVKAALASRARYASTFGFHLSATPPATVFNQPILLTPTFEYTAPLNYSPSWTTFSAAIIGNSEEYITLGDFRSSATSNSVVSTSTVPDVPPIVVPQVMYFFDDIIVVPAYTLSASPSTVFAGCALTLSSIGSTSANTIWTDGVNTYSGNIVTITAPSVTTTYTCSVYLGACMANCSSKTITVYSLGDPGALNVSSSEVCYGQTVTLQASMMGATGYTWYPGAITGGTITQSPPMGTTVYTVVASNSICVFSNTIGVTPYLATPIFTADVSPAQVCLPSNSATLTIGGGIGTYSLYPPSPGSPTVITNTLVLTPEVTTNYTIASYNNAGCLTYSVVRISVVPCACINATGTPIQGTVNPAIMTGNVILKAVSDVTVVFPPPVPPTNDPNYGFIGNEIIAYPGVKITLAAPGGTFILQGVYAHGCGEVWEGFEIPYKFTRVELAPHPNDPTRTTLIEDANIAINMLNNGPASPPPYAHTQTLNLVADQVTFNKNITAIRIGTYQESSSTYPYIIQNCLFTSRTISITPNPAPTPTFNAPSWPNTTTIKNSLSGNTSSLQTPYIDDATYPPAFITSTLYNYTGYPQYGIRLENVGYATIAPNNYYGISIGQTGTDEFNCFDYLQEDINCLNSNLSIINSVFQNGVRYGTPKNTSGGKAIVGYSVDDLVNNINNRNAIRVTGAGIAGSYGCRFYDKSYAIDLQNYYDVLVQNSDFYSYANDYSNAGQANSLGGRGINIKTNRYYYLALQKNNFYNIRSAMLLGLDNSVVNINNQWALSVREIGTIDVNNNNVNRYLGSIPGGANPYVNIGLQISDPVAVPNLTFTYGSINASAMNNTFTGVNNGIYFNSLCNTPVSALNNSVSMINANGSQIGISGVNLVKQASYHANIINGPSSYSFGIVNLYTSYNASLSVRCNTTSNASRGIQFNGMEPTDLFEDNSMDNEDFGLVLDNGAALSNIVIPIGTPSRPTNNQWLNTWSQPKYMAYTGPFTNAQQSGLYIQYSVSGLDPINSTTTSVGNPTNCPTAYQYTVCPPPTGTSLYNSGTLTPSCRLGGGGIGGGVHAGRMLLQQAVRDSIHYETADSTAIRNVNKTFAYRVLQGNPLLMDTSTVLQNFYDTAYVHNPQKMVSIEEQLANGGMSVIGSLLSSFTPVNAMESNYKRYYEVYSSTKNGSYSAADSTGLDSLARLCPFTDGTVVYQARALYNILYDDYFYFENNCYGSTGARGANPTKQAAHQEDIHVLLKTMLYPNPNDGNYVLQINEKQNVEITIFDITGKQVYADKRSPDKGNEIQLRTDLQNGMYLVKIKFEDGTHDVHRLIIYK